MKNKINKLKNYLSLSKTAVGMLKSPAGEFTLKFSLLSVFAGVLAMIYYVMPAAFALTVNKFTK